HFVSARSLTNSNFQIPGSTIRIGRIVRGNEIAVKDAGVSTKHLRIVSDSKNWIVHDLGSSNGTILNSKTLDSDTPVTLRHGDVEEEEHKLPPRPRRNNRRLPDPEERKESGGYEGGGGGGSCCGSGDLSGEERYKEQADWECKEWGYCFRGDEKTIKEQDGSDWWRFFSGVGDGTEPSSEKPCKEEDETESRNEDVEYMKVHLRKQMVDETDDDDRGYEK
uniref:FHA domain-containing protein n=1 Tax=Brassica oleracea var. oleracea TaxID=109376 RepID=A0A0D3CN88_BRAOL